MEKYYDCADSVETRRVSALTAADAFEASWGMPPGDVAYAAQLGYEDPLEVAFRAVSAERVEIIFKRLTPTSDPLTLTVNPVDEETEVREMGDESGGGGGVTAKQEAALLVEGWQSQEPSVGERLYYKRAGEGSLPHQGIVLKDDGSWEVSQMDTRSWAPSLTFHLPETLEEAMDVANRWREQSN